MKKIFFVLICVLFISNCNWLSSDNSSTGTTSGSANILACQTGGHSTSGLIKPCDTCPSDSVATTDGTFCTCTDTTKYFNTSSNTCVTNPCVSQSQNGTPTWPFNGVCTACPVGSTINSTYTGCVCSTGSFDYNLNQCVNITNCTGNQWDYNGVCTDCPSGSAAYINHAGCLCATGTFNAGSNTCISGS